MINSTAGDLNWLTDDVLIQIFSYLTLGDLKQLRLTCKSLNNLVIECPTFRNRTQVVISDINLDDIYDYILRNTIRLNFRNVQLQNLSDCPQLASVMAVVGEEVRCLQLNNVQVYDTLSLTEMPNLRELTASTINVEEPRLLSVWSFASYYNLKHLDINCPRLTPQFTNYVLSQLMFEGKAIQLQRLSLVCNRRNEAVILEVLQLHATTLNYLEVRFECGGLNEECYTGWDEIFQKFHRLHTLKLSGALSAQRVGTFVRALPQSVHLECIDLSGIVEVNDELLGFIARRHGSRLRYVDLSYCTGITDHGLEQLKPAMHSLNRLNLPYCRGVAGNSLTSLALYPHAALRELSLYDMPQLTEDCICKLAENIPNLLSLDLHGCIKGATDKSLAYIFRYQTSLRFLNLFGCIKITDNGLMGLGEQGWPLPMPITRLTGLNALNFSCCRNLTDRTLINALAFKELRKLNLTDCALLTSKGIESLVRNCPAIEDLNLTECTKLTDDTLNSIAVYLKRLRKISIGFCPHITFQAKTNFLNRCQHLKTSNPFEIPQPFTLI